MNNVVTTLSPLFLIGSCSFLQVTRSTIKSRKGWKFGQIRPWTAEVAALSIETYNGRNVLTTVNALIFEWIFFILADKSLDLFEFRQDPFTCYGVSCP